MLNYTFITDNIIERTRVCHACKSKSFKLIEEKEGDGIKTPSYSIYECQDCGLIRKRITKNFRD